MMITDQINFTGVNPLHGPNDENMGPRFADMSHAYDESYQEIVRKVAKESGLDLKEGVYMGFSGPTYETPAEVRMARTLGADAVGMSTVGSYRSEPCGDESCWCFLYYQLSCRNASELEPRRSSRNNYKSKRNIQIICQNDLSSNVILH